jgi:hypothetical protein
MQEKEPLSSIFLTIQATVPNTSKECWRLLAISDFNAFKGWLCQFI